MLRYLCGRLLSLAFVLLAVSMVVFALMHAVPGGPFDTRQGQLPPAARENIARKYGLDQPVWQQYLNYMGHALRLDFGIPYQQPQTTVAALIGKSWMVTLQVGGLTVLVAFGLGVAAGTLAAYRHNSRLDQLLTFTSTLGVTVPNFVVAMWLILLFSVAWQWLPLGGWGASGDCLCGTYLCTDWILPVLAYALAPMAVVARYTRSSILEASSADHVRTARAKGLSQRQVLRHHVLRNAQLPMVTALGTEIPNLITGSIFIETTFRINGLGKYFVTSTLSRDYPMIMATFLLIAALWGVTYVLTDVAYTLIDPRIRLGGRTEV